MTNKTKTFSLLLAGTFLSTNAVANNSALDIVNKALEQLSTHDTIKWQEVPESEKDTEITNSGVVSFVIPDESVKYYRYSYNPNDYNNSSNERKLYTMHLNNLSGDVDADFIGSESSSAYGGAISNSYNSTIGNITGDFINNSLQSAYSISQGGAIYNQGTISNITGNFINNYAHGDFDSYGGAIYNNNHGTIGNITGNFINNSAQAITVARSGAINNRDNSTIGNITGNFINNHAQATSSSALGGAITNYYNSTIDNIINSNFIGNYVTGNENSAGGAIWSDSDILITADAGTSLFSGNKANDKSNAIYMDGANLNLSAVNKGTITFDDGIDGTNYNINVTGDGTGDVKFNNLVENVGNINVIKTKLTLSKESNINNTSLSLNNAGLYLANGTIGTLSLNDYASSGGRLVLDVDPENNISDKLEISGGVSGTTDVVVYTLSSALPSQSIVFATAQSGGDADSFKLASDSAQVVVYANPIDYRYDVQYNQAEDGSREWYFAAAPEPEDPENPDEPVVTPPEDNKPSKPLAYRAEVIAGAGLHEAAIEQTRSVVRNVRTKVAAGREYCPNCGVYSAEWDGKQLRNVWVLAQGETATIDKPVKTDADIWGVEAGFDVQNDVNNTLGIFASYRKGEYDLSGKADKLRSNVGSEIDIDSYLAGLYYRYDKNMNWLFATVYGGVQQADAKTDDKIAKFDTDGIEFGAGIEAGHSYELSDNLILEPSLGLYYTQINFDDAKDNVGKEYDWKDIKHLEAELGAKLEKQIDYAKIYVKPSVIQTITSGDSVKITGLNKLSTYDDATLGRIELGGRYGFTDALSAYGWVNYTFGSDYDATAFGAGVSYSW